MHEILSAWGLADQVWTLHAARENQVYRIGEPARFALRHHRRGLRTIQQIEAELTWMSDLNSQGLPVPCPVSTLAQQLVYSFEGELFSMVTWLRGNPLGRRQEPLRIAHPDRIFHTIGRLLAQLHTASPHICLDRPEWTLDRLVGDRPLWGRFWEHPHLTDQDRALLLAFRDKARCDLSTLDLSSQLIHADLLQENILVDGSQVFIIDFDDCVYGYLAFDMATPLVQRVSDSNFRDLRDAMF